MECKSQICSKRKTRQELLCSHSGHCSQTYPAGKPLSDVEKIASQNFFSSIEQGPLANKITHVLADGCNQVLSGVNNPGIERLLCSQHLKWGQWRKFYSMAALLSPSLFGTVDPSGRKWELGSSIINRCSAEMTMFHKLHKRDENAYLSAMEKVRLGILPCLSGDHRQCRNTLSMCPMHPASSSAARSPKTKLRNFALDSSDIKVLQEVCGLQVGISCIAYSNVSAAYFYFLVAFLILMPNASRTGNNVSLWFPSSSHLILSTFSVIFHTRCLNELLLNKPHEMWCPGVGLFYLMNTILYNRTSQWKVL